MHLVGCLFDCMMMHGLTSPKFKKKIKNKTDSRAFQFPTPHKGISGYFFAAVSYLLVSRFKGFLPFSLPENRSKLGCKQRLQQLLFSKIEVFQCSGIGVSCLVRAEECGKTGFRDSAQCTVTSTNTTTGGL